MISNRGPTEYKVTSKSPPKDWLGERPWLFFSWLDTLETQKSELDLEQRDLRKKTASLSTRTVQKVLHEAEQGGMRPRDFERVAGLLRKNTASPQREENGRYGAAGHFNGNLWQHYVEKTSQARMTALTMLEYLGVFHRMGWISDKVAVNFGKLSIAMMIHSPAKGSRVLAVEMFFGYFLANRFQTKPREIGWILRKLKSGCGDEQEYLQLLEELPARLLGMERYGTFLSHSTRKS